MAGDDAWTEYDSECRQIQHYPSVYLVLVIQSLHFKALVFASSAQIRSRVQDAIFACGSASNGKRVHKQRQTGLPPSRHACSGEVYLVSDGGESCHDD